VRAGPTALSWAAWLAGILAFGWINPGAVGPWRDSMHFIFSTALHAPFPLGGDETQLPATAVSFAVAGGGYLLLSLPWKIRRAS
jgi:hypothetical protein